MSSARRAPRPSRLPRAAVLGGALALLNLALPWLVLRRLNFLVLREGQGGRPELALTFDDGPDPATTPAVLDALAAAGARATFFVLSDRVERFPELARRIVAEGHDLASHGERHRHPWTRTPWGTWREVRAASDAIERAAGARPRFFRPPHGLYTALTVPAARAAGARPVHWTVEAGDWTPGVTPQEVARRVLRGVEPGGIVLLHDAGPGGPVTAAALPDLLAELKRREYRLVPLRDLVGLRAETPRGLLVRMWRRAVDAPFDRANDLDLLTTRASGIVRLGRTPFPGTGRPAAELHLHSKRLVAQSALSPLAAYRAFRRSLSDVAQELETNPRYRDVETVFAVTLLHEALVPLGFETRALPDTPWTRIVGRGMNLLRRLYGTPNTDRRPIEPRLAWMDRATLLERYGTRGRPNAAKPDAP